MDLRVNKTTDYIQISVNHMDKLRRGVVNLINSYPEENPKMYDGQSTSLGFTTFGVLRQI